jgi:hypothetical protein
MAEERESSPKRKEIYTYTAPWTTYTLGWSRSPERKCQLAVGSYIEEYSNQFHIIELIKDDQGNGSFKKLCQFEHPYPATKVMWAPPKHNLSNSDLLATTGDYLRLWELSDTNKTEMKGVLNNNKHAGEPDMMQISSPCTILIRESACLFKHRILCSADELRLVRRRRFHNRNLFYRYNVHNLGHSGKHLSPLTPLITCW